MIVGSEGQELLTPRDSLGHSDSDSDTEAETEEENRGRLSPAAAS